MNESSPPELGATPAAASPDDRVPGMPAPTATCLRAPRSAGESHRTHSDLRGHCYQPATYPVTYGSMSTLSSCRTGTSPGPAVLTGKPLARAGWEV
jgi:hypothetical protein